MEAHLLDLLDDQLGNPVEPFEPHGLAWIEIDHDDLDLPTVPGIDRPWGVHEGHSAAGGEAGAGVHEGGVPVGQGDRHPGGEHRPFARSQLRGLGGDQVGTGVTGVSVAGDRHVRVDPADEYVDGVAHQGFTSKARARRIWSGSDMAAWISSGRPLSMKCSTLTSMKRASARTATGPSAPPVRPVARQ